MADLSLIPEPARREGQRRAEIVRLLAVRDRQHVTWSAPQPLRSACRRSSAGRSTPLG